MGVTSIAITLLASSACTISEKESSKIGPVNDAAGTSLFCEISKGEKCNLNEICRAWSDKKQDENGVFYAISTGCISKKTPDFWINCENVIFHASRSAVQLTKKELIPKLKQSNRAKNFCQQLVSSSTISVRHCLFFASTSA